MCSASTRRTSNGACACSRPQVRNLVRNVNDIAQFPLARVMAVLSSVPDDAQTSRRSRGRPRAHPHLRGLHGIQRPRARPHRPAGGRCRGDHGRIVRFPGKRPARLPVRRSGFARGYPVRVLPDLGSRELVDAALMTGLIQLIPEYTGSALEFVSLGRAHATADVTATATTLARWMGERSIVTARPAAAEDANAIVVTAATAARYRLRTISDLARAAPGLVFGGPPECPERPDCLPGLRQVYGLRFRAFAALDAGGPLTRQALDSGDIGVALLFTTDPAIQARSSGRPDRQPGFAVGGEHRSGTQAGHGRPLRRRAGRRAGCRVRAPVHGGPDGAGRPGGAEWPATRARWPSAGCAIRGSPGRGRRERRHGQPDAGGPADEASAPPDRRAAAAAPPDRPEHDGLAGARGHPRDGRVRSLGAHRMAADR